MKGYQDIYIGAAPIDSNMLECEMWMENMSIEQYIIEFKVTRINP
jgi:hypothetical protein